MKPITIAVKSLAAILLLMLSGCTQPGGNIGDYFGTWVIDTIEIDGENDAEYTRPVMISFQSSIFVIAMADAAELYGTWEETDSHLNLDGHRVLDGEHDNAVYPPILGWGESGPVSLLILEKSSKRLTLQWQSPDHRIYTYYLRKAIRGL